MYYAEDFPKGETYSLGEHKVTADEIIQFGRTYDPQPYHVDEETARASAFEGLIASGWNTCAIWMKLYVTTLLPDSAVEGSPGVDEVRFLQPVRPGDVLHGYAAIVGKIPSFSNRGVVIIQNKGELRRSDGEVALSLILNSRFHRRSSQDS